MALAEALNDGCFCVGLDDAILRSGVEKEAGGSAVFRLLQERCPYIFSALPVFVAEAHLHRMSQVISAVESVVALPAYRDEVLAAPRRSQGTIPEARPVCSSGMTFIWHKTGWASSRSTPMPAARY